MGHGFSDLQRVILIVGAGNKGWLNRSKIKEAYRLIHPEVNEASLTVDISRAMDRLHRRKLVDREDGYRFGLYPNYDILTEDGMKRGLNFWKVINGEFEGETEELNALTANLACNFKKGEVIKQ